MQDLNLEIKISNFSVHKLFQNPGFHALRIMDKGAVAIFYCTDDG